MKYSQGVADFSANYRDFVGFNTRDSKAGGLIAIKVKEIIMKGVSTIQVNSIQAKPPYVK